MSKRFDEKLLADSRDWKVEETLKKLGIHYSVDPDFVPIKNPETKCFVVSVDNLAFEIIATGVKWIDKRSNKKGGGAIDLAMHLYGVDFVTAVKTLTKV